MADEVFAEGDMLCALVGYDDGTELRVCKAATELARMLAGLALSEGPTPASSVTHDTSGLGDDGTKLAAPAPRRVVSVRLVRPK